MEFIFPPPFGSEEDTPSYRLNSILTVSWTPAPNGTATSLTLWQLNSTTGNWFGDMEYITNNVIDRTNFRWIVATTKNLTVSDLFFLSIFEEGKTSADANSVPFTIVAAEDDDQKGQQTETSTLATSTTASTSASTRTSAAVTTDPATTSISPEEDNASAGLATSAKIAIGVTIPLIALLLALAGFLFFKWRRKRKGISEQGAPQQQPYYPQDTAYKPNADLYQWQAHLAQGGHGLSGPSELPGSETGGLTRQYELESQPSQRP